MVESSEGVVYAYSFGNPVEVVYKVFVSSDEVYDDFAVFVGESLFLGSLGAFFSPVDVFGEGHFGDYPALEVTWGGADVVIL